MNRMETIPHPIPQARACNTNAGKLSCLSRCFTGVLPGMRVGVRLFENMMEASGFETFDVTLHTPQPANRDFPASAQGDLGLSVAGGCVAGGSVGEYRCLLWRRRLGVRLLRPVAPAHVKDLLWVTVRV